MHFRRAIETCDACSGCESADVLFCLHFFITTFRDSDLNPHAMYEWAQPYLQALEPKDCRHGAMFLDLLGGWFLAEGGLASARRMYAELLKIANEELADEDAKPTVRELIQEATAQLRKTVDGSP